jgi:WD40 repeat protein
MANKNQKNWIVYHSPENALSYRGGPEGSGKRPDFKCSLAILVGIDAYGHGIPPLRTAVNDARRLAHILRIDYEYEVDLLVEDVTLDRLRGLLSEQLPARLDQDDRVLFYFAGHGIALDGDDGPAGYLVPQDARAEDRDSFLPMHELHEALVALPCRHLLAVLDCCFAGAFRWSSTRSLLPVPEVIHQERYERFIRDPAWQAITSAAYDQRALDILAGDPLGDRGDASDAKHSPFALALFEALRGAGDVVPKGQGDGVITATELYLYLRDCVEIKAEDQARHRQTPGIWPLSKHDKGEYIFLVPGHELNLPPAPELTAENNPYRGLEPYEEEHSELFFGRDAVIEELAERVTDQPLTVVLGASGTGKSSLVKAGLVPYLRMQVSGSGEPDSIVPEAQASPLVGRNEGGSEGGWHILSPLRPGANPLRSLSALLTTHMPGLGSEVSLSRLHAEPDALADLITSWSQANPDRKLLLVVDQLEELVTLCRVEPERDKFLRLLVEALNAQSERFRLVLTLRSDFEPQIRSLLEETVNVEATTISLSDHTAEEHPSQPQANPDLTPDSATSDISTPQSPAPRLRSLTWTRFIVPPMSQAELREAIEGPASERVLYFEPAHLVDRLIDEVIQTPGALPLLSFTLSEMYIRYLARQEESRVTGEAIDRSLTTEDYEALGGVVGSLRNRATQEYDRLAEDFADGAAYQATMRRIMLRMVAVEGGELGRRRVPRAELVYPDEAENQRVETVLQRLLDARLIVGGKSEGEAYVEPAHDALVRAWDRLLIWRTEGEDYLPLQRRLTQAADDWEAAAAEKAKQDLLWDDDPRLPQLVTVLDEDALAGSDRSWYHRRLQSWVFRGRRSQGTTVPNWLNRRETGFVQQSVAKRLKNTRRFINIFAEVFLIVLGFTLIALILQQQAVEARDLAEERRVEADDARALAEEERDEAERQATIALSRQLAAQSSNEFNKPNHELALLLAIEAGRTAETSEAYAALRTSLAYRGRSLAILSGHTNHVLYVAWSPDNTRLVTTSRDGTARVWDAESGAELTRLDCDAGAVIKAVWSPDGRYIVTISEYGTILWAASGKRLATLAGIRDVAWNSNGSRILTVWNDHTVQILDASKQVPRAVLTGHKDLITQAEWSPNGTYLLTASKDGTVRVWDSQDGSQQAVFPDHEERPSGSWATQAAWSPDGTRIVTTRSQGTTRVWDVQNDSLLFELPPAANVSWSQDGSSIITYDFDNVQVWNAETGELLRSPNLAGVKLVRSFERLGRTEIWVITSDGRVWDVESNSPLAVLSGHTDAINYMALDNSGTRLATVSSDGTGRIWDIAELMAIPSRLSGNYWNKQVSRALIADSAGTLRLWDVERNVPLAILTDSISSDTQISWSPDGGLVIVTGYEQGIRIWDAKNGTQLELAASLGGLARISSDTLLGTKEWGELGWVYIWDAFNRYPSANIDRRGTSWWSMDRTMVAIGNDDGILDVWDIDRGARLSTLAAYPSSSISQVTWSPDNTRLVIVSEDGHAGVWDVASGVEQVTLEAGPSNLVRVNWNEPGNRLAIKRNYGVEGIVELWDPETGQMIAQLSGKSFGGWNKQGTRLVTTTYAADDGTLWVWDAANGSQVAVLQGHTSWVGAMVWDSAGTRLVTTSQDRTARIWDTNSGAQLALLAGHTAPVSIAAWSPDETRIVTGDEDGTVRIWDVTTGAQLAILPGHTKRIRQVAWSSDGNRILTADDDGVVRVDDVLMEDLLESACKVAPRNLSGREWVQYFPNQAYRDTCPGKIIPRQNYLN